MLLRSVECAVSNARKWCTFAVMVVAASRRCHIDASVLFWRTKKIIFKGGSTQMEQEKQRESKFICASKNCRLRCDSEMEMKTKTNMNNQVESERESVSMRFLFLSIDTGLNGIVGSKKMFVAKQKRRKHSSEYFQRHVSLARHHERN